MNIADKDLIIFDLDGTLSKSKMPMDSAMAAIFMKLISGHKVAVISGGGWRQYEIQFLGSLPLGVDHLDNLVLLPTSGTQMYVWRGSWAQQYDEHFSPKERDRIMAALKEALVQGGYHEPAQIYGDLIEDRGSQVTFSGLGQHAPVEAKQTWDPDRKIREPIADILRLCSNSARGFT